MPSRAGMAGRLIREEGRRRGWGPGGGDRGGGQLLLPTSAVKEVRRQITPKVLAWNRPQARRSLPVVNVSSAGQAARDGDAGDLMRRRRTIQGTSISSREDGGRVKRPLARVRSEGHEKIGFFRRFPNAEISGAGSRRSALGASSPASPSALRRRRRRPTWPTRLLCAAKQRCAGQSRWPEAEQREAEFVVPLPVGYVREGASSLAAYRRVAGRAVRIGQRAVGPPCLHGDHARVNQVEAAEEGGDLRLAARHVGDAALLPRLGRLGRLRR